MPVRLCIFATLLIASTLIAKPPTAQMLEKITAAAPDKAPATPKQARKLLVFSHSAGFRHSSNETGAAAMKLLGEKSGAFSADLTEDPAVFTAANLKQYDAIALINTTGDFLPTEPQRQALLAFVRGGKGLVGIHAASDAFYGWAEYGQMIGGYFAGHPWNARDEVTLKVDDADHPVNAAFGGEGISLKDEIYQYKPYPYSRDRLRVLLSLDMSKTSQKPGMNRGPNGDYAVAWVQRFGQGRVFYCNLGHNESTYVNPAVLRHYLAGIQFAFGDLAGDATPSAKLAHWPQFRGETGQGIARSADSLPEQWDENTNIVWKAETPGFGHSSPVISRGKLFLVTADEAKKQQRLLAYNLQGKLLWNALVHEGEFVKIQRKNSHASATPACDGKYVYTVFAIEDTLFASALDYQGNIVWQQPVGDYLSEHGYGSSPVLYGKSLIIVGDHKGDGGGYVASLDTATGRILWKTARSASDRNANYSTPALGMVAGRPQLLVHGYNKVISYDPDNGQAIWEFDGPSDVAANVITLGENHVYASGGYPQKNLLAIRADGQGNVTDTHLEWSARKATSYVPSSIIHDGRLYVVNDQGIASAYVLESGDLLYQERLEGGFTGSLILADGKLYITNEQGVTFVIRPGDSLEVIAQNPLPGTVLATPAVGGNRLFIRTDKALYCIGE